MKRMLATAAAATAMAAAPAYAQDNLFTLDYFDTATTHTLEPNASWAQYQLSSGQQANGTFANQAVLGYGLTDTLMVGAALHTGGENADSALGMPTYMVGMMVAPHVVRNGWTPGLQLQYQGGFNQALAARGIFSFDAAVPSLANGVGDRLNLTTNLVAEQSFVGAGETTYAYALAASYPLWGRAMADTPEGTAQQQLQRRPNSVARAAVELKGDLGGQGSHYVVPGLFVSPTDSLQLGLGVGLRLAGQDKPFYMTSQLQLNF